MIRNWRTAAVALGAAVVGVLAVSAPAAADVSVSPSQAARGGAAELSFLVPGERPAGAAHGGAGHDADATAPVAEVRRTDSGGTYGVLGAALLLGLAGGLGMEIWLIVRAARRKPAPAR